MKSPSSCGAVERLEPELRQWVCIAKSEKLMNMGRGHRPFFTREMSVVDSILVDTPWYTFLYVFFP